MTDSPDRIVHLVRSLASTSRTLGDIWRAVKDSPSVTTATKAIDVSDVRGGVFIEGYVDAELVSENSVTWWLEARWNGNVWEVEAEIRVSTREGQDRLRGLPFADTDSARLPEVLMEAARQLALTVEDIDLATI